jgi:hypothetical protein
MPETAPGAQAQEFAKSFRTFLDWIGSTYQNDRNEVTTLVRDFLGQDDAVAHSVISRDLPVFEHVNLQTAIDAWSASDGRTVEVRGIAMPPHFGGLTLQHVISGEGVPRLRLAAPALADLPNGPDSTLGCLRLALLLVSDEAGRYVILVQAPGEHHPGLEVEIAGLPVAAAQGVLAELDRLRSQLNVYRGHLLDVALTPFGGVILTFATPPGLRRDDVVLPEAVLNRVERHALGVAAHRAALLSAGQHLKRGLLLYGPPGMGKTHTTRYLLGRMTGYTRLVLTGRTLSAVGSITEMARALQPSVVVLEDVDLVAEDRSMGPRSSPVLFELLDAMDGAAGDADLLFLLTTNRADLLEPALAARPGRVDVAVEIALPDDTARERLLALYGRGVPLALTSEDVATAVERTDGVTASFLKELIRRSVLEALLEPQPPPAGQHPSAGQPPFDGQPPSAGQPPLDGQPPPAGQPPLDGQPPPETPAVPAVPAVTGAHLSRALDDLLDAAQGVTRALLGVGVDPTTLATPGLGPDPGTGRAARRRAAIARSIHS